MKVGDVRRLYEQGLKDYEISEKLKMSRILVQHTIQFIIDNCPSAESRHNTNRRRKSKYRDAFFINDDPYFEKVNRFVEAYS